MLGADYAHWSSELEAKLGRMTAQYYSETVHYIRSSRVRPVETTKDVPVSIQWLRQF